MNRLLYIAVGTGLAAAWALTGCSDSPTDTGSGGNHLPRYTHPDSLILGLMDSYNQREIHLYADLLAADFRFDFLFQDISGVPGGSWDRATDSTGTGLLFDASTVTNISLGLDWTAPTDDVLRGQAVQRVTVTVTDLTVDIDGGSTTLQVSDAQQLFFFIKGRESLGEDTARWYLLEWVDLGNPGAGAATEMTTWGRIKRRLIDPVPEPPNPAYANTLSHPDSLINNLQLSYARREIQPYTNLLSSDFQFHFSPQDADGIPDGIWNRAADSTGTANLFSSIAVTKITLNLAWFPPAPDQLRGETVQFVEVIFTDLKVDLFGGSATRQVSGDRQLFYFIQGRESRGEDPARLYLFDWTDLGSSDGIPTEEATTWGRIKKDGGG